MDAVGKYSGSSDMELRKKQRLIGGFVLAGVVLLQLPFLFHKERPETKVDVAVSIPKAPTPPEVTTTQITTKPEVDAQTPVSAASEKPAIATAKNNTVDFKPTTVKPTVLTKGSVAIKSSSAVSAKSQPAVSSASDKKSIASVQVSSHDKQNAKKNAVHHTVTHKNKAHITKVVKHAPASSVQTPEAWVMQLGVFSNPHNANELLKNLRAKGYEAYMRSIKGNGKSLLVVYVGPELKLEKMEKIKEKIDKTMHVKGLVKKYQL